MQVYQIVALRTSRGVCLKSMWPEVRDGQLHLNGIPLLSMLISRKPLHPEYPEEVNRLRSSREFIHELSLGSSTPSFPEEPLLNFNNILELYRFAPLSQTSSPLCA